MVIASRVGRAVLGNQSLIGGKVEVLDVLTEKMIAEMHFREQEKDIEFSGNLGILVEVTKNVLDGAMNNRVEKAAKEFADRVKDWLES